MTTLYGISNCDTVKKARTWLEKQDIDYHFHDFRRDGLDKKLVQAWVNQVGWEGLINKRSTTWKGLAPKVKQAMNNSNVIDTILQQPTLIKRPVLVSQDQLLIGFKQADYADSFGIDVVN